jgi:hypothetical protein
MFGQRLRVVIAHVVPRVLLVFTFVIPLAPTIAIHGRAEAMSRSRWFDRRAAREARGTLTSLSMPVRSTVGASDGTI